MRGIGNHIAPVVHQDVPEDNTSRYVEAQVAYWRGAGTVVHPEIAREIAAQFASGDTAFTTFATSGTLDTAALRHEIDHELFAPVETSATDETAKQALLLRALRAYVAEADEITPDEFEDWI